MSQQYKPRHYEEKKKRIIFQPFWVKELRHFKEKKKGRKELLQCFYRSTRPRHRGLFPKRVITCRRRMSSTGGSLPPMPNTKPQSACGPSPPSGPDESYNCWMGPPPELSALPLIPCSLQNGRGYVIRTYTLIRREKNKTPDITIRAKCEFIFLGGGGGGAKK